MLYATFRGKFWGCPVSPAKPSHWSSSSMHLQKWSSLTCGWRTKHHPNAIHYPVLSFQHLHNKFQSPRSCETSKRRRACMYNSRLESSKVASYANTNCRNQELVESVGSRLACHDRLHQNGSPALPHFQRKLPKGPHSSGLQTTSRTWTCQRISQWPSIIHDFHDQPSPNFVLFKAATYPVTLVSTCLCVLCFLQAIAQH